VARRCGRATASSIGQRSPSICRRRTAALRVPIRCPNPRGFPVKAGESSSARHNSKTLCFQRLCVRNRGGGVCLPCRRSRVRIPSAALGNACKSKAFRSPPISLPTSCKPSQPGLPPLASRHGGAALCGAAVRCAPGAWRDSISTALARKALRKRKASADLRSQDQAASRRRSPSDRSRCSASRSSWRLRSSPTPRRLPISACVSGSSPRSP